MDVHQHAYWKHKISTFPVLTKHSHANTQIVSLPTGSTKSALFQYLQNIVMQIRKQCLYKLDDPVWLLGDATCEKMGDLMSSNGNRLRLI